MEKYHYGTWRHLYYKHLDFIIAFLVTCLIYLTGFFVKSKIELNYVFFASIFLGIFTVNFTVFAISKFLMNNYQSVRRRLQKDIDSIFKTPMSTSIIGLVLSLVLSLLKDSFLYFLNPLILFLLIYSIISSYLVFEFLYKISIMGKNS